MYIKTINWYIFIYTMDINKYGQNKWIFLGNLDSNFFKIKISFY